GGLAQPHRAAALHRRAEVHGQVAERVGDVVEHVLAAAHAVPVAGDRLEDHLVRVPRVADAELGGERGGGDDHVSAHRGRADQCTQRRLVGKFGRVVGAAPVMVARIGQVAEAVAHVDVPAAAVVRSGRITRCHVSAAPVVGGVVRLVQGGRGHLVGLLVVGDGGPDGVGRGPGDVVGQLVQVVANLG